MMPLRLDVAVMLAGYLLVMAVLGLGLRIGRRGPATPRAAGRGWPALIRQVAATAVGGYVLLMAVVVGYYRGVARVGGRFLASAFTGGALLIGISLPVLLAASWLVERRRRAREDPCGGRRSRGD